MKIIDREYIESFLLPLPIYKSVHLADAIGKDGSEFDVLAGLDKKHAQQLRELSADPSDIDLQNFTDDHKRFVEGSYEYWYQKNRSVFALVHKPDDVLSGVIWLGPKPLGKKTMKFEGTDEERIKSDWHTMSIRSYPRFRGKGLMKNFSQFAMSVYKKYFPHVRFWSGMDDRNNVMVQLMTDLGFKVDEENSDLPEHLLIMTKVA